MTRLTRHGAGLWAAALVALVAVPAFVEAANAHRGHWLAAEFWGGLAVPGAGRAWSVCVLGVLAAWAAGAGGADPRRARRSLSGLMAAGVGLGVVLLAALPGWVWLARLGAAPPAQLATVGGLAAVAPAVGAGVAGAGSAWVGPLGGVALGSAAGAAVLWAVWGAF